MAVLFWPPPHGGGRLRLPPPRLRRRLVEFRVVAEYPRLVEGNASLRRQVGGHVRARRDGRRERGQRGIALVGAGHRAREGVSQARPDLEQREVDRREDVADGVRRPGGIVVEHALEVAEVLRQPMAQKRGGARLRLISLFLVVERARDRMMGVVNLIDEIGDGKLLSVGEDARSLVVGRKAEFWPDVGDMRHDHVAVAQEWRREWGTRSGIALKHRHQRPHAAAASYRLARDVDIRRLGLLERKSYKLAAPLNARPVEKFVGHRLSPCLNGARWRGRECKTSVEKTETTELENPALKRSRQRPHAVGGFDVAARVVEELAVGRMIARFDPFDTGFDRWMPFGDEFGKLAPFFSGADDEDRAGIRNRLRYAFEKPPVLGYSVSRAFGAVMNVPDRVIRADDGLVRLFDVEVEDARFRVIDPHDCMKMMGHCDFLVEDQFCARSARGLPNPVISKGTLAPEPIAAS